MYSHLNSKGVWNPTLGKIETPFNNFLNLQNPRNIKLFIVLIKNDVIQYK